MLTQLSSSSARYDIVAIIEDTPKIIYVGLSGCILMTRDTRSEREKWGGRTFNSRSVKIWWLISQEGGEGPSEVVNFYSTLPNGWIPSDDIDFFN